MFKQIILLFILGTICKAKNDHLDEWDRNVKRLDKLVFRRYSRHDSEYRFPETARAVFKEYCRDFIAEMVQANELVHRIFRDNTILLTIYKVHQVNRLNMWFRFCNDQKLVEMVAKFNRKLNPYMSSIVPWHWASVNAFLVEAEPQSDTSPGQLICLTRKLALGFMDRLPPNLARHFSYYIDYYNTLRGTEVLDILSTLNVNLEMSAQNCEIPSRKARNPLNLKSETVTFLLALDSGIRKATSSNVPSKKRTNNKRTKRTQ